MGAGEIYAQFGQNMGNMISGAMNQYHQEHVAYDQQYQLADALSRMGINQQGQMQMIDPDNPDKTLQPVLDKKAVQMFQTNAHDQMIKNTGALEALTRMAQGTAQHMVSAAQANQPPSVFKGPGNTQFYRFPGGGSGVINQDNTKGRDPSAQYINAVDAHVKSMKLIKDDLNNNFNSDPADILNSTITKGYVWNKDKGKYDFAAEGQTPEAYQVFGQNGASPMISADQFNVAKKRAQEYQALAQKMPKQEDFTATGGKSGGVGPPPGTRGVISGKPVVWDGTGWKLASAGAPVVPQTQGAGAAAGATPPPAAPQSDTNIYGQPLFDAQGNPLNPTAPQ